jgi:hypothetical protein
MFTGRPQTVRGVKIHSLVLGKTDEVDDYCEDRVQVMTDKAAGIVRAAVADGAAATAFSGQWAELLVRAYCDQPFADWDDLAARSQMAANEWALTVYAQDRPWYALMRAQSGGAAAIAGIEIIAKERKWTAIALGDSCLFQIRNERVYVAIPPYGPDDFGNNPRLIFTDAEKNAGLASAYVSKSGTFLPGDLFVLATDAASEALLRADLGKAGLREWIRALTKSDKRARRLIEALRHSREIRDDDVALVTIEV